MQMRYVLGMQVRKEEMSEDEAECEIFWTSNPMAYVFEPTTFSTVVQILYSHREQLKQPTYST